MVLNKVRKAETAMQCSTDEAAMSNTQQDLAARVQALEDRLDIIQLVMSYPLILDSGLSEYARSAWSPTGIFDRGNENPAKHSGSYLGAYGVDKIIEETTGAAVREAREKGMAHLMTSPHVVVDGDRAVATNYNQLVQWDGETFLSPRVTSNRWELVRQNGRWKIERRVLRLLTGSKESRDLLGRELTP